MSDAAVDGSLQLDLVFEVAGGRTVLARRHVSYPFSVAAPLPSAAPRAEVIVQSASGGIYAGERLGLCICAADGAHAVVRMPSATVVHARRRGAAARQHVSLQAAAGATLLYLPRPLILFPAAALDQAMDVTAAADSTIVMRDGFLLHDPLPAAPGLRSLRSCLAVRTAEGHLIALDRARVDDGLINAASPGVTGAFRAFGTVWLVRRMDGARFGQIKTAISRHFAAGQDCYASTTSLRGEAGAVVRVAAVEGGALDVALDAAVAVLLDALV